jgi:nitrate reductase gamma subunit
MPPLIADAMTIVVVLGAGFFFLRRIGAAEVRNVTTFGDIVILLIVVGPFVTGFIAHQQWLPHRGILALHILSGALWLIVIPFTRLSHMIWFVFSRAYMGSEFGKVRNARDW